MVERYASRATEQRAWHAPSASSIVWPFLLSLPAGGIAKQVASSSGGCAPPSHVGGMWKASPVSGSGSVILPVPVITS